MLVVTGTVLADGVALLGVGSSQGDDAGSAPAVEAAAGTPSFVTGFNQAWLRNAYGSQWVLRFDEAEARRMLRATATFGGSVLRMWLFEGLEMEGVVWDGVPAKSVWGYDGIRTRPTGLVEAKLANVERFLVIAEEEGVTVYLTFFDANIYSQNNPAKARRRAEWWNVLNGKYGAERGFLDNVVEPLLTVIGRHRSAVFAIDLMNELNALVRQDWFENGWEGARRFVRTWRAFIHETVPDLPVSASFGHHDAVAALLARRLPATIVDFYDVHAYNDEGTVPMARALRTVGPTLGHPIYLGEFGQKSRAFDDALQARVTRAFIENARACGLAGALAWRLSDIRPGHNPEARLSFEAFGTWRPAADAFREATAGAH